MVQFIQVLRVASEELTCDQIMQVSEIMAQAISALADEVKQTVIHATYGNHLRTVQNKNEQHPCQTIWRS